MNVLTPAVARPNRRRVLFLNNQGLASFGGGVTILRHLVHALAVDHDVTLMSFDPPAEGYDDIRQVTVPIPSIPANPLWRLAPLRRAMHLAKAVPVEELRSANLVIALDCHFAQALRRQRPQQLIYLSLSCIPRMEWFGGVASQKRPYFLQYLWLERAMVTAADAVVVASRMHADEMRRYELLPGFNPTVLHPVFPACNKGKRKTTSTDTVTILSAGRLVPIKNFAAVIDMADRLRDLPCRFVVAGDGPELSTLIALSNRLGLGDRVQFVGVVNDLEPLLAEADIFLHPTLYESFAMVVCEAMQAELPVVLAGGSLTGCREVLHDDDFCLADFSHPDEAALLLRRLVSDRSFREQMGRSARRSAAALLATDYVTGFRQVMARLQGENMVSARSAEL